jgi:agmatine deiminase
MIFAGGVWYMPKLIHSTPKTDGYRMPGEFEAHAGCWMLWPERRDNWRLSAIPAQNAFVEVATAITCFEPVSVGASTGQFVNARDRLPARIRVVEMSSNDAWMRDCGPTFVVNDRGGVRGVDWEFNAWGGDVDGLYSPWDLDEQVARKVLEIERLERYKAPMVLEGGSIHVDGKGTLLTTEECLLSVGRNPQLSRRDIESLLSAYLNVKKIVWLGDGVVNDETNGHIDNLACFIRPGVVALTWTENRNDPQYDISQEAYERLVDAKDVQGRRFEIHKLHQPDPLYITEEESQGVIPVKGTKPRRAGDRMAASYVNFYIANNGVIVPTFDDPHDLSALAKLAELFPGREVVGVPAREILLGGGNIHCITQQQPSGR